MHGQGNFSYSVGGGTNHKNRSYVPQFDDMMFPPTDLNGSNFLPQLQKVNMMDNQSTTYQSQ